MMIRSAYSRTHAEHTHTHTHMSTCPCIIYISQIKRSSGASVSRRKGAGAWDTNQAGHSGQLHSWNHGLETIGFDWRDWMGLEWSGWIGWACAWRGLDPSWVGLAASIRQYIHQSTYPSQNQSIIRRCSSCTRRRDLISPDKQVQEVGAHSSKQTDT